MIFIHHYSDTEREERPPPCIRHVACRWCDRGGPTLSANNRGFVSAKDPQIDKVMSTPETCGADYWEIVVEATDL